ncbi:sensor histidine kinase [Halobacillus rhizosphaerae]|uniref:sensor histidine kinase n=1 Tax=Halobacillus rhizosphaerae TaxID=3064889 RepID=UPI00398B9F5B
MIILLTVVICLLILVILMQFHSKNKKNKEITYVYEKLETILADRSSEKILLFTDDTVMKELVTTLNHLLRLKEDVYSEFKRTEGSMKKMLSNISHDLKTPLTVVLGYLEMITSKSNHTLSQEEKEKMLTKVYEKVEDLLVLINKFFDLAKLESGDKDFPLSRIEINEICRNNILGFYEMIQTKDMEVSIEIPETPSYAIANEEALNRVLNNLISNAIRYGSEGKIIGLRVLTKERLITIEVWDRGRGIEEAYQEQVFERMYTMEDSRNIRYQGSGLGLTITKRLVKNLGGQLTLHSVPYEKTTFSIQLGRIK